MFCTTRPRIPKESVCIFVTFKKYIFTLIIWTFYHTCPKSLTKILQLVLFSKTGRVANSVGPDQTPRSAASDLGLYSLHRTVCLTKFI